MSLQEEGGGEELSGVIEHVYIRLNVLFRSELVPLSCTLNIEFTETKGLTQGDPDRSIDTYTHTHTHADTGRHAPTFKQTQYTIDNDLV